MVVIPSRPIVLHRKEIRTLADKGTAVIHRACVPQPTMKDRISWLLKGKGWPIAISWTTGTDPCSIPIRPGDVADRLNPYGRIDSQLWVKEDWAPRLNSDDTDDQAPGYVKYRADLDLPSPYDPLDWHRWPEEWRPADSMPRWASRFTVAITQIRIELPARNSTWFWVITLERWEDG